MCECPCHSLGMVCIAECMCPDMDAVRAKAQISDDGTLWVVIVDPVSKLHEIRHGSELEIIVQNTGVISSDTDVMAELFKGRRNR